jgi:hypothetical protein
VTAQRAQEYALKRSAQRRIAEDLRAQCKDARVSQRRVADYLGMTPSTFHSYMAGVSLWPQGPAHFGFAVTRAIRSISEEGRAGLGRQSGPLAASTAKESARRLLDGRVAPGRIGS